MNKTWLLFTILLSLWLMLVLKTEDSLYLQRFFIPQKMQKLPHFAKVRPTLSTPDQDLLELWESMLTGNTRPLNKLMKEDFSRLGLRHLFTPSGLHLSSLLYPSMKIIRGKTSQLILLSLLALILFPLAGFIALKRMVLVKWLQKISGLHFGFALALLLDILFGSFQIHTLSFTYSFLFLGIMYSGVSGSGRVFWFFMGQGLIAFSQGVFIAPLILLFSPLLSFCFVLSLPLLFLLTFPLWNWQLDLGLLILRILLKLISWSAEVCTYIPVWEMHLGMIVFLFLIILRKWKFACVLLLILSSSLNLDLGRAPSMPTNEFRPQGEILKVWEKEAKDMVYYSDGKCERVLVRGQWWEKCSPRRRSIKKSRKLSYPSSELRRSSLRG